MKESYFRINQLYTQYLLMCMREFHYLSCPWFKGLINFRISHLTYNWIMMLMDIMILTWLVHVILLRQIISILDQYKLKISKISYLILTFSIKQLSLNNNYFKGSNHNIYQIKSSILSLDPVLIAFQKRFNWW
jgi:hypothetical protein